MGGEAGEGWGEVAVVDDGEAVGGAGEGDVEVVAARRGLGQMPAGSTSTTRSNSRPLAWPTVSRATGESSTSARVAGHRRGQGPGQLADPRRRGDDGQLSAVGHVGQFRIDHRCGSGGQRACGEAEVCGVWGSGSVGR